jgi:hemerythrin
MEKQAPGPLTSQQTTDEFFLFLKLWLKSHICGIDTQYAKQAHAA